VHASPNPVKPGDSTTLSASVIGGSGSYTYSWTFGDGGTSSSTAPSHSYSAEGNYTATITVKDAANTQQSGSVIVQVTSQTQGGGGGSNIDYTVNDTATGLPIAQFGVLTANSGESLTFISINATGTISWDFGDGSAAVTGSTVTHAFNTTTDHSYTVKLTANSQTKSKSITINGAVGGLSGTYTSAYTDGTPLSRAAVTFGKSIHFVASDTGADSYQWDFGDTAQATGAAVDHAYTIAGSYQVKLAVTKAGNSVTTPSPLTYTVLAPPAPTMWLLGGMAYTDGAAGTFWQSDVSIFNPDQTRGMLVSVAFLSGSANVDPSKLVWTQIVIDKNSTKTYRNVLDNPPFGLPKGSFGAILVRGDNVPTAPVITGRTYNSGTPSAGTYGLSVPAVPVSAGVSGQSAAASNVLIGMREHPGDFRTNLTVANLGANAASADVQFFDANGLQIGSTIRVNLAPYGIHQINRVLSSVPPDGAGYTTAVTGSFTGKVTLRSGTSVFPYATVINEKTGDPIVVTTASRTSASYRLPGIVRSHGRNGTLFQSDLTIYNPSTSARDVSVRYTYQAFQSGQAPSGVLTAAKKITLQAYQSVDFEDFVSKWLPSSSDFNGTDYANSYVDISPAPGDPNTDPLVVLGQTYNANPRAGFQVPGYTPDDGSSQTGANHRLVMTGLSSSASYRTNVAVFLDKQDALNIFGNAYVRVYGADGTLLKTTSIGLSDSASSFTQINDSDLFGGLTGDLSNVSIVVDTIVGNSPLAAYATMVDNTSGDAVLVQAQPAP
jgi:PKD repeat protein